MVGVGVFIVIVVVVARAVAAVVVGVSACVAVVVVVFVVIASDGSVFFVVGVYAPVIVLVRHEFLRFDSILIRSVSM